MQAKLHWKEGVAIKKSKKIDEIDEIDGIDNIVKREAQSVRFQIFDGEGQTRKQKNTLKNTRREQEKCYVICSAFLMFLWFLKGTKTFLNVEGYVTLEWKIAIYTNRTAC